MSNRKLFLPLLAFLALVLVFAGQLVRNSAGEDPIEGVTGALVSGRFHDPEHVHFEADWQAAADYAASVARDGDYIITLGCGNVNLIVPQVLDALGRAER